jgi:class 3 adenylate cyclase
LRRTDIPNGQHRKTRDGQVVPGEDSIALNNDAVKIQGTVLYADISDSTKLVDGYKPHFAAEMYKSFLRCAAKIIRAEGGTITAYDGDRVMAVYIGNSKNTSAVRTALKINWAVKNIIQPAIKNQYPSSPYVMKHVVGIDTSDLFVAQAGIRGSRDLYWVGRAANYAAKNTTLSDDYPTWITHSVHDNSDKSVKNATDGRDMWEERSWTAMDNMRIYRSSFWWSLS